MSIFKIKFYFEILPRLYISLVIQQLTSKFKILSEKNEKLTGLLSTLIFELNEINSNNIMDGRPRFPIKSFIHFMKKMEILKECHCLY